MTKKVVRRAGPKKAAATSKTSKKSEKKAPARKRLDEATLMDRYPQVVKGSLSFNTSGRYKGKQSVKIDCAFAGCRTRREVATSDLFQISMCEPHVAEARKDRRAEARKAKKAA